MITIQQKPVISPEAEKERNRKKQVSYNRKARFNYEIEETYDAGMALAGTEVKSIRAGKVNFVDAFCRIENGEMFLYNMHITPYELGNRWNVDPIRKRKLLLHKSEIQEMKSQVDQKGMSIVPLAIYFQRGFAKLEIAIAKGKQQHDKRHSIADKDRDREERRSGNAR